MVDAIVAVITKGDKVLLIERASSVRGAGCGVLGAGERGGRARREPGGSGGSRGEGRGRVDLVPGIRYCPSELIRLATAGHYSDSLVVVTS